MLPPMLRPICDTEPMDDGSMDRLRAARAGLEATRSAVEARAPWPLATTIDDSEEAHWGPPEVLAHVAEMVPYWQGEMERVLAGSPEPEQRAAGVAEPAGKVIHRPSLARPA